MSNTLKVLEKFVYNHLYNYCSNMGLLSTRNSGFKKKDGTVNQLLHLIDKIYKGLDDEKEIAVVFLDITKAFDRVWHLGVLYKLRKIGLGTRLINWIKSYLKNRKQRVVIGGKFSRILLLLAGVPQGSILGPLLFLLFIDDLEKCVENDINLFADDTILSRAYKDSKMAETSINNDLSKINEWATKWLVEFNPIKTVFINFSLKKHKTKLNLKFKGHAVAQVSEHKHLGFFLSEDLTWHKHINFITARASQRLGQMYRSSIYLTKHQLSCVYLNMIRPILEYGSILYDNCTIVDNRRLENVQRRAALICTGAMRRTENNKIMQLLGWPSLENRRKFCKLVTIFKISKNLTPNYLSTSLLCRTVSKVLRNINPLMFEIPNTRLTCYKTSFFPSSIKQWNLLPQKLTESTTLTMFKLKLSCHLQLSKTEGEHQMFNYTYGYYGKMLTQIKFQLSKLNNHLFLYNISDNPFCPRCHDYVEDTQHYFYSCDAYTNARAQMMQSLLECLACFKVMNINMNDASVMTTLILDGVKLNDKQLTCDINKRIFAIVKTYLKSTNRFCK